MLGGRMKPDGPGSGSSPTLEYWNAGEWLMSAAELSESFQFPNGEMRLHPLLTHNRTADRIACEVAAAGDTTAVVRMVIYEDADGDGIPDTLLLDAGTVGGTTGGTKEIIISQALPDRVWLSAVNQGAPTTLPALRYQNGSLGLQKRQTDASPRFQDANFAAAVTGVTGAAPATITPTLDGQNSTSPPWVALRSA